jgi:diadenosine tetraphosphate (Ap4A) HIT family hydrolase
MNSAASSMIPQLDGGLRGNAAFYESSCHVRMHAVFRNQLGKNDAPDYTASPARVSGVSAIYFTLGRSPKMTDHQPDDCDGCDFAAGKNVVGGNILLPGSWSVNHYAGPEGFLGWLALQPCRHLSTFSELHPDELKHLGPNIATIEKTLKQYWKSTFADSIERLYTIYFLEGGSQHMHIHLIPRFESLESRLRNWNIPRATMSATFPAKYRRSAEDFTSQVCCIMNYLRSNLSSGNDKTA